MDQLPGQVGDARPETVTSTIRPSGAGDIAVVGASTSGLYTALLLAREEREVTVYERGQDLVPAPRALIVTSAMRDYLGDVGSSAITNQVERYELYANGKVGEVRLGRPDLIVERSTLVEELAERAQRAGATIRLGARFNGMGRAAKGIALDISTRNFSERVEARSVVGADGATSAVARHAGWDPQPTVPLLQAIVPRPEDLRPGTARVWFVPEDTPYFYWLIPESDDRAALGVIGERTSDLRARFDRFLEKRGMQAIEYQGARIPRYERWTPVHRKVASGDVYLVGDAAGQVKISTVGGLVTGFRGAIGVADAILGKSSRRKLRSLKRELDAHLLVRKAVHRFGEREYCRLLDLLNDPARDSLQRHTRDEATAMLWRLALKQPRFVSLSIRGVLSRQV